ncbi:MAG: hypothetical protein ACXVCY_09275 [Pseudobdellovibrionaceae bacterium]
MFKGLTTKTALLGGVLLISVFSNASEVDVKCPSKAVAKQEIAYAAHLQSSEDIHNYIEMFLDQAAACDDKQAQLNYEGPEAIEAGWIGTNLSAAASVLTTDAVTLDIFMK